MAIGDLQLPLYPWGSLAPMMPQLAKAQSNVTASNIPGAKIPGPYDFLNAMSSLSNVQGENALRQQQMGLTNQQAELIKQRLSMTPQFMGNIDKLIQGLRGGGLGGAATAQPVASQPNATAGAAPSSGGEPASSTTYDATLPREARAFLDTVAGPESGGKYNVRYTPSGGAPFESFADHPRIAEPGPAGPSTAAGRYQIVESTWDPLAKKYGLSDFSKVSQDQGAWHLAQDTYRDKTGRDLLKDLQEGDTSRVPGALGGQWPTITRSIGKYASNLDQYSSGGSAVAPLQLGGAPDTVENAPTGGSTPAAQGYTGKAPTYERAPPATASVVSLQSAPLAVHDAFAKYRQEGGQLPIEQFMAGAEGAPPSQPVRLAQNGPMTSMPSIRVPQLTPAQGAPVAPQAQMPGSLAPQGQGGIDPMALAIGALGAQGELIGFPNVAGPLGQAYYNSPGYIQQKAGAEAAGKLPYAGPTKAAEALASNPLLIAQAVAQMYPPGSQQRAMADAYIAKEAGVKSFIGGERAGVPMKVYDPATNSYRILPVPGQAEATADLSRAVASGPAAFKQEDINGPYGQNFRTTALNAATMMGNGQGAAAVAPAAPGGGNLAVGGALPPPAQQTAPGAPPTVLPTQRPESAAPTFPVQTPAGTKDISDVSVGDLFPGGQGIPTPPKPPPGATYGPASAGQTELQKKDADRVEQYGKESAENQKVYQDLSHIRDILQRGLATSKIAPAIADLNNIAQGLGVKLNINGLDPNDSATLNKAATDLVFAQVKKLAGQVRVAEIEGYQKASPSMTIPPAANLSIINDMLSAGKWQDARARLAQEYLTSTGGAPLSAFESKFSQVAPLADVTEHYKQIIRQQDPSAKFPGDQAPVSQKSNYPTQTLGGKTYEKRSDGWYLKVQ